jgi:hypothetical protein
MLAVRVQDFIDLWRISDGELLGSYEGFGMAWVAWQTPQGVMNLLAVSSSYLGRLKTGLWQVPEDRLLGEVNAGAGSLVFSPGGRLMVQVGREVSLVQVPETSGQPASLVAKLAINGGSGTTFFSPEGRLLAYVSWDGAVSIWGVP